MSDRNKKRQWAHQSTGTKGTKTTGQLVKEERKKEETSGKWTMAEKIQCIDLYAELQDYGAVALKLKRPEATIRKLVSAYTSTSRAARLKLEAGAEKLADRIVENANVEESLEVMDRLDILNKKQAKVGPQQTTSILIVGMPNARSNNPLPMPSTKQIADAVVEGNVTEVK